MYMMMGQMYMIAYFVMNFCIWMIYVFMNLHAICLISMKVVKW